MEQLKYYLNLTLGDINHLVYPECIPLENSVLIDYDREVDRQQYTKGEIEPWFESKVHKLPTKKQSNTDQQNVIINFGISHFLEEITDKPLYEISEIGYDFSNIIPFHTRA